MPKNRTRTPAESAKQKSRTTKNKIKYYSGLIIKNPNNRDKNKWEGKLKALTK